MASPNTTEAPSVATGSATGAKVATCLVLLFSTLLLVFLPLWIWRRFGNQPRSTTGRSRFLRKLCAHGLSAVNCFAGGVFLATAFIHLLVDAEEAVTEGLEALKMDTSFPVANAFVLAGIVLIMIFEQVATFNEHSTTVETQNLLPADRNAVAPSMCISNRNRDPPTPTPSSVNSLILVLAISIHSIFEGLAIGLQTSSSTVYRLLLVVSFHKIVVTVSLGLQLAQVKRTQLIVTIFGVIYSCAAPLGVFIGSLVANNTDQLTVGILQSLACGTFIYVAAFEILPGELRAPNRWRTLCVGSFTSGLSLIVLINLLFPHEHAHGHSHHH